MVHNLMNFEITMKKKEPNIIAKNLINYQYRKKLQKLNVNDVMMDFDAKSLYPSAMWVENSVFSKVETGFVFKPQMNKVYVEAFNNQTFNQDGEESAILRLIFHNPSIFLFQQLPVKEKLFSKKEVTRMRNG